MQLIAQRLVNMLLAFTAKQSTAMDKKTAEQLFQHIWLTFLAEMLRKTLSSDAFTALVPKDRYSGIFQFHYNVILILSDFSFSRVFVTLLYMGFKSMQIQQQYSGGIHLPVLSVLNDQPR